MPPKPKPGDETPSAIRSLADLSVPEASSLRKLLEGRKIEGIVESDMFYSGQFGRSLLVLTPTELVVVEGEQIVKTQALDETSFLQCRPFVGNGVLEIKTNEGVRVELIRYSNSRSAGFEEAAEQINKTLSVSEEELEAQADQIAGLGPAGHSHRTYRCPNCDHPLINAADACPKCTSKRAVMFRLVKLMKSHWKRALLGFLISILFAAANLAGPRILKELVDKVVVPFGYTQLDKNDQESRELDSAKPIPRNHDGKPTVTSETDERFLKQYNKRLGRLFPVAGLLLAVYAISRLLAYFRIRVIGRLSEEVVTDLRAKLYRTLQRLSLSYYDREHTGRIMARVLSDTRMVQRFVARSVQQMVVNLLIVIGITAILFSTNWKLAAVALLPVPAVVLCAKYFSRKFRRVFRSWRRKFATLSASVSETISGMRVVKSFGQEEREIDDFEAKNTEVLNARLLAVRARSQFGPFVGLLLNIGAVSVWLVGAMMVIRGHAGMDWPTTLTLGTLLQFIMYMNMFYNPVRQLMDVTESFQEAATAAERIFNIMDMPSEVTDTDQAISLDKVEGSILIDNISFGYNENERVLKNITLDIKPGKMIGLVGQTGSGKSTLASLICRFYDPQKGRILLDGHDLRDIKTKDLRRSIGMVLQDSFLFAGSIKANIAYGRQDASEAEIIRAAKAANAHDFIMNLPDGYDNQVGERGVKLSGGEKQRVSIARAILKDPAILILDEATSAVDTATEAVIQEAMDRVVAGRTTIAIAHRLSTLRNADWLVVLSDGEIVEQGTHEDLLKIGGVYANLVKIQAEIAPAFDPEGG